MFFLLTCQIVWIFHSIKRDEKLFKVNKRNQEDKIKHKMLWWKIQLTWKPLSINLNVLLSWNCEEMKQLKMRKKNCKTNRFFRPQPPSETEPLKRESKKWVKKVIKNGNCNQKAAECVQSAMIMVICCVRRDTYEA